MSNSFFQTNFKKKIFFTEKKTNKLIKLIILLIYLIISNISCYLDILDSISINLHMSDLYVFYS